MYLQTEGRNFSHTVSFQNIRNGATIIFMFEKCGCRYNVMVQMNCPIHTHRQKKSHAKVLRVALCSVTSRENKMFKICKLLFSTFERNLLFTFKIKNIFISNSVCLDLNCWTQPGVVVWVHLWVFYSIIKNYPAYLHYKRCQRLMKSFFL